MRATSGLSLVEWLLVRYRVEELAARARISVDTVRFYQTRGLLSLPEREGRVVFYSDEHVVRLERIRALKDKGFTLKSIKGLLAGEFDAADEALVAVVEGPADPSGRGRGSPWPNWRSARASPSRCSRHSSGRG